MPVIWTLLTLQTLFSVHGPYIALKLQSNRRRSISKLLVQAPLPLTHKIFTFWDNLLIILHPHFTLGSPFLIFIFMLLSLMPWHFKSASLNSPTSNTIKSEFTLKISPLIPPCHLIFISPCYMLICSSKRYLNNLSKKKSSTSSHLYWFMALLKVISSPKR